MKSFWTAFSMYSQIPVPSTQWTADSMAWALCCFPFIGIVSGFCLYLWLCFSFVFSLPPVLMGVISVLIPILISGGIHLDGFCDTMDALASNAPREKRLEILKDTHAGAFSGIGCALYLILLFAAWTQVPLYNNGAVIFSLTPVLSRSLSAFAAFTLPNARGSGLLASFTEHTDLKKARIVMLLWILLTAAVMIIMNPRLGLLTFITACLTFLYYVRMSKKHFGGITGDLAGFFLQLCELTTVIVPVILQYVRLGGHI